MIERIGEDLGKFLHCSSLLEGCVAKAYEHIAKLISDRFVSCLFKYIARDSFKHAECFRLMAEILSNDLEVCSDECVKIWGEAWSTLMNNAEKVLSKNEISLNEISYLVRELERLEVFAAEEYLTVLHAKIIELIMEEGKMNLGHYRTILKWIIEDEEKHRQILKIIEETITRS